MTKSPANGISRADRTNVTREAILAAAERVFAEYGLHAVSNRKISEAAGQGNNAAVGYHFGTRADLVRAIERRHRVPIERVRQVMVAEVARSTELRDWVACLVRPLTDHLAELGNPCWYARFAAQAMADDAYEKIVVKDALTSPSLVEVIKGINRCLPHMPAAVHSLRSAMTRNMLLHTVAELERRLDGDTVLPGSHWQAVASGVIDGVVGVWLAPVTA